MNRTLSSNCDANSYATARICKTSSNEQKPLPILGQPSAVNEVRLLRPISLTGALVLAVAVMVGCRAAPGASVPPSTAGSSPIVVPQTARPTSPALPVDGSITPVSASNPGEEAAKVLTKCNIGDQIELGKVTGMGKIPQASDLARYVPLTGREPQLKEAGAAWIVTISAELPQPGSTEHWINPTCVVTDGDVGYFATGPVKDVATGKTVPPEKPAVSPEFLVPQLAP